MLHMVSFQQITAILELTDRLGLSREWVEIPLSPASPGLVRKLPSGKLEIVVDADQPFEQWVASLENKIRKLQADDDARTGPHSMTDSPSIPPADESSPQLPSREDLQAELLDVPERPDQPKPPEPPGVEQLLSTALSYLRGRRGADLLAVILVGSGAKRALTQHSDLDLIAVIKGKDESDETVRVADRIVEIRYRELKGIEQDLAHIPRLPPLLRKGRVLFDLEAVGAKLIEKAGQRFRGGPPAAGMHEKIRLKAECYHRLGKAQDLSHQPAVAQYLLGLFLDELLHDFFRLRGFWPTAPTETLRFAASRDAAFGDLLERFQTAPTLAERLQAGRDLANHVFRDVPLPQRID